MEVPDTKDVKKLETTATGDFDVSESKEKSISKSGETCGLVTTSLSHSKESDETDAP